MIRNATTIRRPLRVTVGPSHEPLALDGGQTSKTVNCGDELPSSDARVVEP